MTSSSPSPWLPFAAKDNKSDIENFYVENNPHLGHYDDVREDEQGQFVALPTEGVLRGYLDSVGSTDETEEEIFY